MKQTETISVIVPVYNVEKYLPECIESILGQTYQNLEIILVDDGALDRSGEICEEYAAKDARIKVVHKQNGGLSDARNAGLEVATSPYIAFVDADDYIDAKMYENLYGQLVLHDADVAYGVTKRLTRQYYENEPDGSNIVLEGEDIVEAFICGEHKPHILKAAWDKLYTREVIGDSRFIKGIHGEDAPFNLEVLAKAKRCVFVGEIVYYYRDVREGSISGTGISERLFTDKIPILRRQIEVLWELERTELAQRQECVFYDELMRFYSALKAYDNPMRDDFRRRIRAIIKDEKQQVQKTCTYGYASRKYRIRVGLFLLCPSLFNRLIG